MPTRTFTVSDTFAITVVSKPTGLTCGGVHCSKDWVDLGYKNSNIVRDPQRSSTTVDSFVWPAEIRALCHGDWAKEIDDETKIFRGFYYAEGAIICAWCGRWDWETPEQASRRREGIYS